MAAATDVQHSANCVEHVESAPFGATDVATTTADEALASLEVMRAREAGLLSQLSALSVEIERAEAGAHGVVRCDPLRASEDDVGGDEAIRSLLRDRAQARAGEWAAALGGGRISLSQAFPLPPSAASSSSSAAGANPACEARRVAWAVQLFTRERRLQVAAVRLSGLPPDGSRSRLVDVTWLDAEGGSDGVHHGLPRLAAFATSIEPPIESYDLDALGDALRRLELPPKDYVHLCRQPLMRDGSGECVPLTRVLAAIGAEVSSWARLDEPLPPRDGAADALHFAMLNPPPPPRLLPPPPLPGGRLAQSEAADNREAGGPLAAPPARADLAVRWWARLHCYVGAALLGHPELGTRRWLDAANASLRAYRGGFVDAAADYVAVDARLATASAAAAQAEPELLLDAPSLAVLVLRIARHPHADDERRRRANALVDALIQSAPPAVSHELREVAERQREAAAVAAERRNAAVRASARARNGLPTTPRRYNADERPAGRLGWVG
jgi:hypothetical protein